MAASKAKRRVKQAPVEPAFVVEKDEPATVRVLWPTGHVDVCKRHAKDQQRQAKATGKKIDIIVAPAHALCGVCRAEKRNERQRGSKWRD